MFLVQDIWLQRTSGNLTTKTAKMYNKRLIFGASCVGMLLFGISLITLGSIAPDLQEKLKLDGIASGTLFSILPLGILTSSLLFGPVADKYGYRLLMGISCLFMFVGFEGIAFIQSQHLLKICVLLFGFGGGAINGATNALVSDISDTNKGASLSLLGAFFGIGALGMPLISGLLKTQYGFEVILAAVGAITLVAGILFLLIRYPLPKQPHGFPFAGSVKMLKDSVLIIIAFFLFLQSSFEGILNNWTTTFLINNISISQSKALYALSSFVFGMTVMRLLLGTLFRSVTITRILSYSFVLILAGVVLLRSANNFNMAVAGLILTGAGLAGGFPIMLGIVGNRYKELSGTAFSFVLVIGLIGNMTVNFMMGYIAQKYGIQHLTTVAFAELFAMVLLFVILLNRIKNNEKRETRNE